MRGLAERIELDIVVAGVPLIAPAAEQVGHVERLVDGQAQRRGIEIDVADLRMIRVGVDDDDDRRVGSL